MVVANATTCPWDRLDTETNTQWGAFVAFRDARPEQRAEMLRGGTGARKRGWCKLNRWRERAAMWDDSRDAAMVAALTEAIAEMRRRHANVGRQLLDACLAYLTDLGEWRPADLLKLAEFARRLEVSGLVGTDRDLSSTTTAAKSVHPLHADEWDQLAADMSTTMPTTAR